MAIVAEIVLRGITPEQFDRVRSVVGYLDRAPSGGLTHVTWWDGDACHNVDTWESEAAMQTFAQEQLGPAMAQVGVADPPQITVPPAHEVYAPRAVTLAATPR